LFPVSSFEMLDFGRDLLSDISRLIAGEIVLSDNPGRMMRKWREFFEVSQAELAERMGTTPSVISDYESGRRKSPGSYFIRKFVTTLISIELERGGKRLELLMRQLTMSDRYLAAVIDMMDFTRPISFEDFLKAIDGEVVVQPDYYKIDIHGYTIVDSIRLVLEVSPQDYFRLYGTTTERAAIFTNVKYGRSPLIAIHTFLAFTDLRPAVVVLHGIERPDPLGLEIAKRDRIPLVVTRLSISDIIRNLRRLGSLSEL